MRQLFRTNLKLRANPILLNYNNNFHRFTFLETQLPQLNPSSFTRAHPLMLSFVEQFKSLQSQLIHLQNYDFSQSDLRDLAQPDSQDSQHAFNSQNLLWKKNHQNLKNLSDNYQKMQKSLYSNLSALNLKQLIPMLAELNCIDIKLWQKIVALVARNYQKSALDDRWVMMLGLSEYLKKFQFGMILNKKPAFKFMFPESYIVDLIDFRSFFKFIESKEDFITQADSKEDELKKIQVLESQIYLIMKATKKADMNIYAVRDYFHKRTQQMIQIASKQDSSPAHKRVLYNIYFIYSYLNFDDKGFFLEIEKYYFEEFKRIMQESSSINDFSGQLGRKSKELNKVLSIWKLNRRPNLEIYHSLIRPFLRQMLDSNQQRPFYSNICINLLTAGIKDHQIIRQMVQKCDKERNRQDEFTHVLKHYLNITDGAKVYESSFSRCKSVQNPKIIKYLQRQNQNIFSSCLEERGGRLVSQKSKSIEHHRIQKIWSDIVKKTFEYQYEVIQNATICNYQIDFLILAKKQMIAIEVLGGHYSKKEFLTNENVSESTQKVVQTGKKEIKEIIMKAYNIKTVYIHCEQKIPTYVMQSKSLQLGIKYLKQKIANQIGLETVNL